MVFSTTNLFKGIQCPEGERCKLTNCIYGHEMRPQAAEAPIPTHAEKTAPKGTPSANGSHMPAQSSHDQQGEPSLKRRRVIYESLAEKPLSRAEKIKADLEASRSAKDAPHATQKPSHLKPAASGTKMAHPPASLSKPVSPPPVGGLKPASKQTTQMNATANGKSKIPKPSSTEVKPTALMKKESLNPRLLTNAPESHAKRTIFLQHIHKDMVRLNNELKSSTQPIHDLTPEKLKILALSDQEVIKLALDEEEKAAREQPKVYANVIKNRISAFRKMKADAFVDVVKSSFNKEAAKPKESPQGRTINTGLTPDQEVKVAQHLVVLDQNRLSPYGYIPVPPTAGEAEEAAKAVESSMNYEECDRCSARFRVFPDRNEEGNLTSNGPCRHHPDKKAFPTRQKTDHYTGGNQPYYPCCMDQLGSPGCKFLDNHVFKASSPARLAAVLPFITTPDNANPAKSPTGKTVGAVGFDCEMGYTVYGLELIRITAVSWPENELLLDTLVRPLGTIVDLNTRFSGVTHDHFTDAIPYAQRPPVIFDPRNQDSNPPPLPIVDSPQQARSLLCSFLTPQTPLIGHAIENDLNATRLCHPSIIDTILLYPHPRGLPIRFGLKMLTKKHLERDIQTGGASGHDSLEDAVATGDLVRMRISRQWREMQGKGFEFQGGELVVPEKEKGTAPVGLGSGVGTSIKLDKLMNGVVKSKKRNQSSAGLDGVDEDDDENENGVGSGDASGGEGLSVGYLEEK